MKKDKTQKIYTGAADPSRRNFLKGSGALAAAIAAAPMTALALKDGPGAGGSAAEGEKLIGIQLGAVSFMDEGVEQVLDILQQRAGVNTIFMSTFCYDRGLNGRQMPGQPFPDHGSKESDEGTYHGGFYATPHAKFYEKTAIKGDKMVASDFGGIDVLAKVLPVAKKKGIKVFASVLDTFEYPEDVLASQLKDFVEVDLQGQRKKTICFFRPDVREFWKAVVTDLASSYAIDGIMFFNERNGPLINAVGATHTESFSSSHITCFCEDHKKAAEERGIDFGRAKEGFHKLDEFVQRSLRNERPSDGYYVEFQRLMLQYPEMLAYQQLFDFGKHRVLEEVRDAVKAVNKNIQVGFHIEHVNSWNPFYRAGRNYEALASMADLLKVVVYNNCAGERYVNFIRNIQSSIFRDVPAEELMRLNNHLLNYGNEASLEQLPAAGFSPDYVYRETARAIAGVKGKCKVLPGIDIGIPTAKGSRKASPDDTYAATMAALKAKPDGVIFSRKYSEMMLANLEAAGRAVRGVLGLVLVLLGVFVSSAANAQSDTVWTKEKAARWFTAMDWFKGTGGSAPVKKRYDAFGRELQDEDADTASKAVVNGGLRAGSPVNQKEFFRQYHANPSRWDKAFAYLKNTDFSTLPAGRYPIDGDDVYAVITLGPPKAMDDTTTWESHRNYEDIHYVISGKERIGIIPLSQAKVVRKYDPGHDLAGYLAKGSYYVATPELFFIITTEEAHRPGIREEGCDMVKKLFIKVRKS